MYDQPDYQKELFQKQCRNGPVPTRKCTDPICLAIYFLLILIVIGLTVFCSINLRLNQTEIEQQLTSNQFGKPLLAIYRALGCMIMTLLVTIALCIILVITTLIFPSVAVYFYIPLMLILMLFLGVVFLYRYFGNSFPFISQNIQDQYMQKQSILALVAGIIFILGFIIAIATIFLKLQKFSNILPVLKMAKICFWENFYMFFISIFLSVLTLIFLQINIVILGISQWQQGNPALHIALTVFVIIQALWTHGLMQSLSDFIFQAIAINWYFKSKRKAEGYNVLGSNCSPSISLAFKHFGTIIYGSIYAYIPDFINFWLSGCEKYCQNCYGIFCFFHKFICRQLSRYSHSSTILQGYDYCSANKCFFALRVKAKYILPQIYLMGNFFMTIAKILITMFAVALCYIFVVEGHPQIFSRLIYILPPLAVVFLAALQIGTHFMNCTGLIGDTIAFMYMIDLDIEKMSRQQNNVYSCPDQINLVIAEVRLNSPF